jgi:hypothetical protein
VSLTPAIVAGPARHGGSGWSTLDSPS